MSGGWILCVMMVVVGVLGAFVAPYICSFDMATSPQLDMIPAILRKHTLAVGNAPHIRTVWINCARGGEHSNLVFNGGPIKLGKNQAVNWAIPLAALVLINHSSLKLYFETQACGTYSEATTKRSHQKHRACSSSRF